MTVYIELVIFNNLAVDLLLEIATLTVFRRKAVWWRVLLGAIIGAGVATVYPLCPIQWQIVIRVLLAPIMVLVFDSIMQKNERKRRRDKKLSKRIIASFFKRLFVFCLVTYFVGGVTYGINFAFGIDVCSYWQMGVVALSLLTMLITVRIIVMRFSKHARKICDVCVQTTCTEKLFRALCDSGNSLVDALSGLPVVILSNDAEQNLQVDESMLEGYIQVNTVNSAGSMPLVRLQSVDVDGKKFNAYAALARKDFEDFDMILQNTMF